MAIVPMWYRQDLDAICTNILLAAVDNKGLVVVGLDAAQPLIEAGILQFVACDWVEAPLAALELTKRGWRSYKDGKHLDDTGRRVSRFDTRPLRPAGATFLEGRRNES